MIWRLRALLYRLGWLRLPHHRSVAADAGERLRVLLAEQGLASERERMTGGEEALREHLALHYQDAGVAPPWEER